jgi:hypothetical protein
MRKTNTAARTQNLIIPITGEYAASEDMKTIIVIADNSKGANYLARNSNSRPSCDSNQRGPVSASNLLVIMALLYSALRADARQCFSI